MIFCYLLESTELCGGVRVVFDQARALMARGHTVLLRAKRGDHRWYHHPLSIEYLDALDAPLADSAHPDVVIATFWTTVRPALALGCAQTYHFCQGYEGDIREYAGIKADIDAVYRLPAAKLTLGPWLTQRLQTVYGPAAFACYELGQVVDTELFTPGPPAWLAPGRWRPANILVVGQFENHVKGIRHALQAVNLLRNMGIKVRLTRVAAQTAGRAESALTGIDRFLVNIPPPAMRDLYRQQDLLLASSLAHEGFGLPFAEALACGLPCVATQIPSYLSFAAAPDYACFVPPADADAMAQAAAGLILDAKARKRLRRRGAQLIPSLFAADVVAARLESLCACAR